MLRSFAGVFKTRGVKSISERCAGSSRACKRTPLSVKHRRVERRVECLSAFTRRTAFFLQAFLKEPMLTGRHPEAKGWASSDGHAKVMQGIPRAILTTELEEPGGPEFLKQG